MDLKKNIKKAEIVKKLEEVISLMKENNFSYILTGEVFDIPRVNGEVTMVFAELGCILKYMQVDMKIDLFTMEKLITELFREIAKTDDEMMEEDLKKL